MTIIYSALTAFTVCLIMMRWHIHMLNSFHANFFKEQEEWIKKQFAEFVDLVKRRNT